MAEIRSVGDFNLATAEVITSAGLKINIKPNIIQIDIFEDMTRNSIAG